MSIFKSDDFANDISKANSEFSDSKISDENSNTIPGNTSTNATISVGQSLTGTLETPSDVDWYRLTLGEDETVFIELTGSGSNPVQDTYLYLYNSAGVEIAQNDDYDGFYSGLTYTAVSSGTYYVGVESYSNLYSGGYRLEVETALPATLLDSVQGVNPIDDSGAVYVYFMPGGRSVDGYVTTSLNSYERAQLFSVYEGIEEFADIDFRITTIESQADLTIGSANLGNGLFGYFNFPDSNGNGSYGMLNDTLGGWSTSSGGGLDQGGFAYSVAVHEFGHGLGLGHTHDTGIGTAVMQGVSSSSSYGDYDLNQTVYTAMSYNDGWQTGPDGMSPNNNYGFISTFAPIDIAALQNMYGVNTSNNNGVTSYTLANSNNASTGYSAIWDTGGRDNITYTGSSDAVIDLRAATLEYEIGGGGFMSYVDGVYGGFTIANGVVIEQAFGGRGDDLITGNAANNLLDGGAGNDDLIGADGNDELNGSSGNDELIGGEGSDELNGGSGNDTVYGDAGRDRISGNSGNDFLYGGDDRDTLRGGSGSDDLYGGEGNNRLYGGDDSDTFIFAASDTNGNSILDYEDNVDTIDFGAFGVSFSDLEFVEWRSDTGVRIKVNDDFFINVTNVDISDFRANDFEF
ncbi:hypothetical protein GCM10008927_22640 [Amylibacter ulvae]|uniref:Serralysin n=1 Tax=Paramylibacter ulvae TaxID=1651968 RepID=A0ABQ3D5B0_9RHOB|nr:M10 family metallopeptidase C-terminal domain-containing protein [Amylibacter ulvae]GHA56361.1 hypothetical protein GCM10008927_22640 [Amylibacter ulvae]